MNQRIMILTMALTLVAAAGCGGRDTSGPNGSAEENCCECVQTERCGGDSFSYGECVPDGYHGIDLVGYDFDCISDTCATECAGASFRAAGGLHKECPADGCLPGQQCVTAAAPGGETRSCEIHCDASSDCPQAMRCNLPPIVPDSIPNVCVEE